VRKPKTPGERMAEWKLPPTVRGVATHEWFQGDDQPREATEPHRFEGYQLNEVIYAWTLPIAPNGGSLLTEIRTIRAVLL
jgi:hypothetical protein